MMLLDNVIIVIISNIYIYFDTPLPTVTSINNIKNFEEISKMTEIPNYLPNRLFIIHYQEKHFKDQPHHFSLRICP